MADECIPIGVSTGQGARVVIKYLRDHPEQLHEDGPILTFNALIAAFPCTKK
jgi:hypothetical protein